MGNPDLIKGVRNKQLSRSGEINDIIEIMPSHFGLYVTGFMLILVFLMGIFGWLIKYPDVVSGELSLNATLAPVKIVCNTPGKLVVNKFPVKSVIKAGTCIGYIKNSAKYDDVKLVDSLLKLIHPSSVKYLNHRNYFPEDVNMGELSEKYFAFLQSLYAYLDHYNIDLVNRQIENLKKLAISQKQIINGKQNDLRINSRSYSLLANTYTRDSILFDRKVLSIADLERTRMTLLAAQRDIGMINHDLVLNEYQFKDAISKLDQLKIQKTDTKKGLELNLISSYYTLTENIHAWQNKYTFVTPITGILEFTNFWNNDDYVFSEQELFSIIPTNKDMYAQMSLPEIGAGKVRKGQEVVIKLNDFPFNEYGAISGKVEEISLMTNQKENAVNQKINLYRIKVSLPNGLQTNYGTKLNFRYGAKGTADIITADRRLVFRLFDNLKYQVHK